MTPHALSDMDEKITVLKFADYRTMDPSPPPAQDLLPQHVDVPQPPALESNQSAGSSVGMVGSILSLAGLGTSRAGARPAHSRTSSASTEYKYLSNLRLPPIDEHRASHNSSIQVGSVVETVDRDVFESRVRLSSSRLEIYIRTEYPEEIAKLNGKYEHLENSLTSAQENMKKAKKQEKDAQNALTIAKNKVSGHKKEVQNIKDRMEEIQGAVADEDEKFAVAQWVKDTPAEDKKYAKGSLDFIRKDSRLDTQEAWDALTTHLMIEEEFIRLENLGFKLNKLCPAGFAVYRKSKDGQQELTEDYKQRLKDTLKWVDVTAETKKDKKRRLLEEAAERIKMAEAMSSDEDEEEAEVTPRPAKRAKTHQN